MICSTTGNRWFNIFIALGLAFFLWLSPIAPALAQNPPLSPEPPVEEEPTPAHFGLDASAISSEKISQFVRAYLKVVGLIEQRESDLQAAETESESFQMQQEIQSEALTLIEAEGLTTQEYLQLLGLANIDVEFGERVAAQLQEATE